MSIDWDGATATVAAAIRARGVETDLGDAELVSKAAAERESIARRLGTTEDIVRRFDGGYRYLFLDPPIGTLTSVTEDGTPLVLDTGFRVGPGGAYIERLDAGVPTYFGRFVTVTYDATPNGDLYDRVVIDLLKLDLNYSGLDSVRDGDYAEESKGARGGGGQNNYQAERDLLIAELMSAGMAFA